MTDRPWLSVAAALLVLALAAGLLVPPARDWLLAPLDPGRAHVITPLSSWHGRLMVLAWGFMIPVGILIARFFKIMPGQDWPRVLDNARWWVLHLNLQRGASVVVLAALCLILLADAGFGPAARAHRTAGWAVLVLLAAQVTSGMLRGSKGGPTKPAPDGSWRGDHYDMTLRRRLFERFHKSVGYLAQALAILAIGHGLWLVNAPRWMAVLLVLWLALVLVVFATLQAKGRARDTYEAIWGPDPEHPGNRLRPIGWGVRRGSDRGGQGPDSSATDIWGKSPIPRRRGD